MDKKGNHKGEVVIHMFNFGRPWKRSSPYQYRLILDVGTEFMKAVFVEYRGKELHVLGYSRVPQRHGDMEGGLVASIQGALHTAREAMGQACHTVPHRPRDVVMGIAGSFVKGTAVTVNLQRRFPRKPINARELSGLMEKAQRDGLEKTQRLLKKETRQERLAIQGIHSALVEMKVDGFRVADPLDFKGHTVSMTVFCTFCPLMHLSAVHSLARGLGLPLTGVLAEPYAVASAILNSETYTFGAMVIDIGGGTTDIGLIRNGGVEGTEIFAMGGRAFTRSLASAFSLTLKEAEEVKLRYSRGQLVGEKETRVREIMEKNSAVLFKGLETGMTRLARGEALPKKIYICGGGSSLRGLMSALQKDRLFHRLPYLEKPQIVFLKGEELRGLGSEGEILMGAEHVTPAALALEGVKIGQGREAFPGQEYSLG